jgi:hypothetical protein
MTNQNRSGARFWKLISLLLFMFLIIYGCKAKDETAINREVETKKSPVETPAPKPAFDACELINSSDVETVIGNAFKKIESSYQTPNSSNLEKSSNCMYKESTESILGSGKSLRIFANWSLDNNNSAESISTLKANYKNLALDGVKLISGLGDNAFSLHLLKSAVPVLQLHVFKGKNFRLILTLNGFKNDTEGFKKLRALAEIALDRYKEKEKS